MSRRAINIAGPNLVGRYHNINIICNDMSHPRNIKYYLSWINIFNPTSFPLRLSFKKHDKITYVHIKDLNEWEQYKENINNKYSNQENENGS